jgi:hypothetical protein
MKRKGKWLSKAPTSGGGTRSEHEPVAGKGHGGHLRHRGTASERYVRGNIHPAGAVAAAGIEALHVALIGTDRDQPMEWVELAAEQLRSRLRLSFSWVTIPTADDQHATQLAYNTDLRHNPVRTAPNGHVKMSRLLVAAFFPGGAGGVRGQSSTVAGDGIGQAHQHRPVSMT